MTAAGGGVGVDTGTGSLTGAAAGGETAGGAAVGVTAAGGAGVGASVPAEGLAPEAHGPQIFWPFRGTRHRRQMELWHIAQVAMAAESGWCTQFMTELPSMSASVRRPEPIAELGMYYI